MQINKYFIVALFVLLPQLAWAANFCVRPVSNVTYDGDGSSWASASGPGQPGARRGLPSTLTRGNTYYFADGSYTSRTLNEADSGTNYIYLKKATASAHGTDAGWDSSYGDGVATFSGTLTIRTNYWDIDGVVGSGESGHGFKFQTSGSQIALVDMWSTSYSPNYINFRHCEFQQAGEDQSTEQHIFRVWSVHNLLVQDCFLHDVNTTHFQIYSSCQGFTLEYSVLARRHTTSGIHGEHMMLSGFDNPANIIIRHNIFYDCMGSGMVYFDNSNHPGGAEIYGNVFYQNSNRYYTSNGMVGGGSSYTYNNIKVYNNTFINAYGLGGIPNNPAIYLPGTGSEAKNNVCYNTGGILSIGSGTKSYNLYNNATYAAADGGGTGQNWTGGTGLFQDYTNNNYRLAQATNAGTNLGSPYNQDMDGRIRGADGVWERGAYEYQSGSDTSPNPPTNLRIINN